MQKELSSGDRHLVGLGRAATEVSQGPAPSAAGRTAPRGAPVPLSPPPKTPNHGFLQQRGGRLCQRHRASGSHGQRRSSEKEGWNVAMVPVLPLAGGDERAKRPGTCLWEVSGPLPAPAHGTARGKRSAEREEECTHLLVGRRAKSSAPLSCARQDKAWRECSGGWRRDAPRGSQQGSEAFPPWHHTSVCLL